MSVVPFSSEDEAEQFEKAQSISPIFCKLVADIFGLGPEDVDNLEAEHTVEDQQLDFSGIDAILTFPSGNQKTVAFRERPEHPWKIDLPIRTRGPNGGESEWQRWESYALGLDYDGQIPDVLVYGLIPDGESNYPVDCWLFNVDQLIEFVFESTENPRDNYPEKKSSTRFGSKRGAARYIPLDDAVDASCMKKLV